MRGQGYAEDVAALALGDELIGVLHTGDLGRLDGDGFLCSRLELHWSDFDIRGIDRLPLLGSGKVDYVMLERSP